ncbi:hypothetical protein CRENBAI_015127 [Crenichthys baileyi]|uniref:Uncharacterized protein n=1 Tax=Crenichthys baileyi TaxID=28760 RepID=A0AAV9SI32_9TELE
MDIRAGGLLDRNLSGLRPVGDQTCVMGCKDEHSSQPGLPPPLEPQSSHIYSLTTIDGIKGHLDSAAESQATEEETKVLDNKRSSAESNQKPLLEKENARKQQDWSWTVGENYSAGQWDRVTGAADSVETSRCPSPQTPPPAPPGGPHSVPRPAKRYSPSSVFWAVPWASSRWDVPGKPPEEGLQEASAIGEEEPPQLAPLDVEEQRLYSELLTLSLRECPATLRRKLISAACIWDLVLSVMTQSSWP